MVRAVAFAGAAGLCMATAGCDSQQAPASMPSATASYPFDDDDPEADAVEPSASADSTPDSQCGDGLVVPYIGQKETPALKEQIAGALKREAVRWIHPGEAVTDDFSAARLNIVVNEKGLIVSARCG